MSEPVTYESAMVKLRKLVFKNRIRVKEFFVDFDKLNSGYVYPNHFMSALSMASVDKHLTPAEMEVIREHYMLQRSPSLVMVDHRSFLHDIELVFTIPHLEKDPLVEVPPEPSELLDKTRYEKSSRLLPDELEAAYSSIIQKLSDKCFKRGQPVKAFFDDAAMDDHSAKLFGHVTIPQFRQVMSTKLDWTVSDLEFKLIVEKFRNEDKPEFVNYIAFSNTVDPPSRYAD